MTDTRADTAGAIAGLTNVLESMEHRIAQIDNKLTDAKRERINHLDRHVSSLLPGISRKSFDRLKREEPRFVDRKVTAAFAQNGKLLGIFRTAKYDAALTLLRTQLKKYLESKGLVATEDSMIMQLEAERTKLTAQQAEAMEMLKLVERAHRLAASLPRAAATGINTMAQRGRSVIQSPGRDRKASAHLDNAPDSNSDLWLWIMTDIPTSFRTLMLDTLSVHNKPAAGGGLFGGAGAQGSWETSADQAPTNTQPAQSDVLAQAAGFTAGVVAESMISASSQAQTPLQEAMTEALRSDPDVVTVGEIRDPNSVELASEAAATGPLEWPAQNDPAIATDDRFGAFS